MDDNPTKICTISNEKQHILDSFLEFSKCTEDIENNAILEYTDDESLVHSTEAVDEHKYEVLEDKNAPIVPDGKEEKCFEDISKEDELYICIRKFNLAFWSDG